MIPCPSCGEVFGEGEPRCAACGGPRLVALGPGIEGPACKLHRDRKASCPCPRCGAFACATCLVSADGRLLCRACHLVELASPAFAWQPQTRGFLRSYVKTVLQLIASPVRTLEAAPRSGAAGGALLLALGAFVTAVITTGALITALADDAKAVEGFAMVAVLAFAVWLLVLPVLDWALLRALGVEAPLGRQVQGAAYALAPLALPLPIAACLVFPAWSLVLKLIACRKLHRVSWPVAALAAFAMPVLVVALMLFFRLDVTLDSM